MVGESIKQVDLLAFVRGDSNVAAVQEAMKTLGTMSYNVFDGGVTDVAKYLSQRGSPKVLVVDVSQSDLPLSDLNSLAEVCDPSVQVIVIGVRNDVGLYRDMIRMGVYDYLVIPILPDLLVRSIQSALAGEDRPASTGAREGKVITFVAARGGAGATTIATNLAWLLANEKMRRVVIVDLNLHLGTVSLYFDLKPDHGLREALENPSRVDDVFVERLLVKVNERLEVLSAEEPLDSNPEFSFEGFSNLVQALKQKFHFVIVDVPRRFNAITRHVIESSSVMMIVADPSLAAIRDVDRYYRQFGFEGKGRRVVTILNKFGQYKKGEVSTEDFEATTKRQIHHIFPFDGTMPLDCSNKGVMLASCESKLSIPMRTLADDVSGGVSVTNQEEGMLGKLKKILTS